jgi:hypothetical protein
VDYRNPSHGGYQTMPAECECGIADDTVEPVQIEGHDYGDGPTAHWLCETCRALVKQGLPWRSCMLVDTENRCPENCDDGILRSCVEDPGHPCPSSEPGREKLQAYLRERFDRVEARLDVVKASQADSRAKLADIERELRR